MDIFKKIAELSEGEGPFILATITKVSGSSPAKVGFRLAVSAPGQFYGTIGGGTLEKLVIDEAIEILEGRSTLTSAEIREFDLKDLSMECGGRVELMLEQFGGRKSFTIFGGGHLGRALAPILELLGYEVIVYDNRSEVLPLIESEGRRVITSSYEDISSVSKLLSISDGCFIATHGHEWDETVLRQVLMTAPGLDYIGMIGSKVKVKTLLKTLQAEGLKLPESLYSPVGLKIGGDTAAEIAVSIAAEIIAVKNVKEAPHMRLERG